MRENKDFEKFKKMFAKNLKAARVDAGYTQKHLGRLLKVSDVSICCYEKGVYLPNLRTLFKISSVLRGTNFRIEIIYDS